ncbi:MAG: hypothetical protein HKN72_00460 [Gemmatimonadetes bacterium]|nr:hypothetical protein [Gemmatimonadota bacterium]NNL30759.1 hypothetical protein [Gemmatimonadota bacterium]
MRRTVAFALSLLLSAAACGPAEVVVTIEVEVPNPEGDGTVVRALSDVEVQLVPFDRDAVFDSLTQVYGTPEPEVPQELIDRRLVVQDAQAEWDEANRLWSTIRDTLQKLNTAMEPLARGEARYVTLFREWQEWESQLNAAERDVNQTFAAFDSLQQGTIRESDSVRILQDNWADDAYAGVGTVFSEKARVSGLDWVVDTTDANGVARGNLMVKPGTYWVHARYELPYTELYWNHMITVEGGEPMTVRLTRENAQERIAL